MTLVDRDPLVYDALTVAAYCFAWTRNGAWYDQFQELSSAFYAEQYGPVCRMLFQGVGANVLVRKLYRMYCVDKVLEDNDCLHQDYFAG